MWFHVSKLETNIFKPTFQSIADNENEFYDHTLEKGWSWIGRRKDNYDFELRFWKRWVFLAWPFVAGHIVLGQICRYLDFRVRTAYSTGFNFIFPAISYVYFY